MRNNIDHHAPPKIPAWVICLVAFGVVASWLPLALIARSRVTKSERQPIHLILDMDFQPKYGPQEFQNEALAVRFNDGRAMRPPVAGAVRHDLATFGAELDDDHFFRGYKTDGNLKPITTEVEVQGNKVQQKQYIEGYPKNITVDRELIERGRDRYNIYCTVCHGRSGYGDGPVHTRIQMRSALDPQAVQGWVQPRDLHMPSIVSQGPSQIFDTITNGFNNMRGYAAQISIHDRWAIAAYVKALQLSQDYPADQLPGELKGKLETAPAFKKPGVAVIPTYTDEELKDEKLIAAGKQLFTAKICYTCHQVDENVPAPTGEVLKATKFMGAFWGKEREVHVGIGGPVEKVVLDQKYFLESVAEPMKKIVKGAQPAMAPLPTTDEERKALLAYVKSLSK